MSKRKKKIPRVNKAPLRKRWSVGEGGSNSQSMLKRTTLRNTYSLSYTQEKNNGFPFLDTVLGYLKNIHKNPKIGKVRQVPTREFPTKFPD